MKCPSCKTEWTNDEMLRQWCNKCNKSHIELHSVRPKPEPDNRTPLYKYTNNITGMSVLVYSGDDKNLVDKKIKATNMGLTSKQLTERNNARIDTLRYERCRDIRKHMGLPT